jgi:predicted PolB exonuclease-like 3'-5' exonuclease
MSTMLSIHLSTKPSRSCVSEKNADARHFKWTHISSISGLRATRDESGSGYCYHVEDFVSLSADGGEKALILEFDTVLSRQDDCSLYPFLIGFRSSTFDMPLLKLRAMRHRIALSCLGAPQEDRYGRTNSRWAPRYHFDLANEVLGYRNASLDDVCELLSIPMRTERSHDYMGRNAWRDQNPVEWAELSVVIQWALFLQWSLVINELNVRTFELSLESFCIFLEEAGRNKPHIAAWLEAYYASAEVERAPFSGSSQSHQA